jgi:hypothetical protein
MQHSNRIYIVPLNIAPLNEPASTFAPTVNHSSRLMTLSHCAARSVGLHMALWKIGKKELLVLIAAFHIELLCYINDAQRRFAVIVGKRFIVPLIFSRVTLKISRQRFHYMRSGE